MRQAFTLGKVIQDTSMHGTINGQMVIKNVISFGTAVLNDVANSPQMKYNR